MTPQQDRSSKIVWPLLGLAATISLAIVLFLAARDSIPAANPPLVPATVVATATASENPTPAPSRTFGPQPTITEVPTLDQRLTQTYVATVWIGRTAVGATAEKMQTDQPLIQGPPPTGIFVDRGDVYRYPNQDVALENLWQNVVRVSGGVEYWAVVYAGARHSDPRQGLVLVDYDGPAQLYFTPTRAGSVHIVSEHNLKLTLLSTDGTTFYFDVSGQKFVNSLTAVVPTVTPFAWPTGTRTPVPPTAPPVLTCTRGPTPSHATSEPDCLAY